MIKELFLLVWEIIADTFTFKWKYLVYDFTNLWWYLIYGFSYSDIQDMDKYLTNKVVSMLPKFLANSVGIPNGVTEEEFRHDLNEIIELAHLIYSDGFDNLKEQTQLIKSNRFKKLLGRYYFHLWF